MPYGQKAKPYGSAKCLLVFSPFFDFLLFCIKTLALAVAKKKAA